MSAMAGTDVFVATQDGLRIHARQFGMRSMPARPVVCLPGLTRTVADFESLALRLARTRCVIAVDSRGRGQSDYDNNPHNYNVAIELGDVVTVLREFAIEPAVFIGSSRGGILTMLLAAAHPEAVVGAVLHDIGPVIEPEGIARIRSYVGKLPQPGSFAEGAEILQRLFGQQFPKLTMKHWLAAARRAWKMEAGNLLPTYDVRLAEAFTETNTDQPPTDLWKEFDALGHVPLLVIRGANSDILSAATVNTMRAHHPGLESIEIADQGHVPLLEEAELLDRIVCFVEKCERVHNQDRADTFAPRQRAQPRAESDR
jgi:pimeloyl-ACP methyl ester carboxylesterase